MTTVSIDEARARLHELIAEIAVGEAVLITRNDEPVARLVPPEASRREPVFGSCKDKLTVVSDDDEHLADFGEYMK